MMELIYSVILIGLAFLAVFCGTVLSIVLEPVGATARLIRSGGYLGGMFAPALGASLVLIGTMLFIPWRGLYSGGLMTMLIATAGLGFLTLLGSPFASWWSWRRFGRVYYPVLLGSILISLAAQHAAVHLMPAPTYYVGCTSDYGRMPEPPLNMRLGDTLESQSDWAVYQFAGSDPGAILLARVPRPLLPWGAPDRWQAVQIGTLELQLGTYAHVGGGQPEGCMIPITIHSTTP